MPNVAIVKYEEMIRINPEDPLELQWKPSSIGNSWFHRFKSRNMGNFLELEFNEQFLSLDAKTDKGYYSSTNGGRIWHKWPDE